MIDFDPGTAAPTKGTNQRNGGDLVVETLEALGAKTVFGLQPCKLLTVLISLLIDTAQRRN
jgi:hypothetical protein